MPGCCLLPVCMVCAAPGPASLSPCPPTCLQNTTLDQFGTKNAHLAGINYLRNVEDADKLVADMKEAKKVSDKAVVVGGG